MAEDTVWTYKTTVKAAHSSAPSVAVTASAPLPPSNNTLFASSTLEIRLEVRADELRLKGEGLQQSALARNVRTWFDQLPTRTHEHAQPPGLDYLDLILRFRSPLSASAASQSQSSASKSFAQESASLDIASQLLHPESLHFTLAPLVVIALERVAKKLAVAFPLCFSPKYVDRLTNDLPAHRSIATSLNSILNLSETSAQPLEKDVETSAALLNFTLSTSMTLKHSSDNNEQSQDTSLSTARDPKAALTAALLLIAKEGSTPNLSLFTSTTRSADPKGSTGPKQRRKGRKRDLPAKKDNEAAKKVRSNSDDADLKSSQSIFLRRLTSPPPQRRLSREQDDQADIAALHDFFDTTPSRQLDNSFSPIDDDEYFDEDEAGGFDEHEQEADEDEVEEPGEGDEDRFHGAERLLGALGAEDDDVVLTGELEDSLWA
ncbi:hypothetical protein JCM6882_003269 [Rhodosporidiobolus microsporus]